MSGENSPLPEKPGTVREAAARLRHVVWGELLGDHPLPDWWAGAVRTGDARQHQEENPESGRLLRGEERDVVLPAAPEGPGWIHGAGGGAAGRPEEGTYQAGAHHGGRRAPEPAAHVGIHLPEVLVERWVPQARVRGPVPGRRCDQAGNRCKHKPVNDTCTLVCCLHRTHVRSGSI